MEDSKAIHESQCPAQYRPLFKAIAKNYPTSGMLESQYANDVFKRLLSGEDRIISVTRREALAAGFPTLFEVVRSCAWKRIPREFVPLLKTLRAKARIPLQCPEVLTCTTLLSYAVRCNFTFCPSIPLIEMQCCVHAASEQSGVRSRR
jgi:hypothetical protein